MSIDNEKKYQNSQICWICKEKINNDKDKVRDHSHINGNYRGVAHNQGNSKLIILKKLSVIFHNWEKYDGHIIFKELNNFDDIDIKVIAKTSEKYVSIIINSIWTGGREGDLAPPVRFFSVAPEVVMEDLLNLVTFPKIYLRRFSKKNFLVTMDCVAMATKLLEGSQDKKSIYFF